MKTTVLMRQRYWHDHGDGRRTRYVEGTEYRVPLHVADAIVEAGAGHKVREPRTALPRFEDVPKLEETEAEEARPSDTEPSDE